MLLYFLNLRRKKTLLRARESFLEIYSALVHRFFFIKKSPPASLLAPHLVRPRLACDPRGGDGGGEGGAGGQGRARVHHHAPGVPNSAGDGQVKKKVPFCRSQNDFWQHMRHTR